MDDKVLDYGDSLLRQRDVQLLRGPYWLNDQVGLRAVLHDQCCSTPGARNEPTASAARPPPVPLYPAANIEVQVIGFYFEYLTREAFTHPGLLLVSGSSTFLLANLGPDGAAAVLEPLRFPAAQLALFAVNDNPDVEAAGGGSHWSLLAFSTADATFRHYDSCAGGNRHAARRVFQAACPRGSRLVEQPTPQQRNGYDCGVYVLALARLLCQRHTQQGQQMSFDVGPGEVTPAHISGLRQEVLHLITSKAAADAGG